MSRVSEPGFSPRRPAESPPDAADAAAPPKPPRLVAEALEMLDSGRRLPGLVAKPPPVSPAQQSWFAHKVASNEKLQRQINSHAQWTVQRQQYLAAVAAGEKPTAGIPGSSEKGPFLPQAIPPVAADACTHLNLREQFIGPHWVKAIARRLIANATLVVLDLTMCDVLDEGVHELLDCLDRNATLRELSLAGNHLTAASGKKMAAFLTANSTLQSVSLAHNRIGDVGATALAGMLRKNTALEFLNLRGNEITDVGAQRLLDAIVEGAHDPIPAAGFVANGPDDVAPHCPCLNALWLRLNPISEELLAAVTQQLILRKPSLPDPPKKKKGKKK